MRNCYFFLRLLFVLWLIAPALSPIWAQQAREQSQGFGATGGLEFVENRGQVIGTDQLPHPEVKFVAASGNVTTYLLPDRLACVFARVDVEEDTHTAFAESQATATAHNHDAERTTLTLWRMDIVLVNSNPNPIIETADPTPTVRNYYQSHIPGGLEGIQSWRSITYREVWPGIDMLLQSSNRGMKCEFLVHPGADPSQIRLRYVGTTNLQVPSNGTLVAETPLGQMMEEAPVSFQRDRADTIPTQFLLQDRILSFRLNSYDPTQPLLIDPTRIWGTYYGGSVSETVIGGRAIAHDASNNVYFTGQTYSTNFPTTTGAFQTTNSGDRDGFLVKLNSGGVRQWATYFGGTNWELPHGVEIDGNGDVDVVGHTESNNFPTTTGAYQTGYGGVRDAFIIQFSSSGSRNWATYYGGAASEDAYGLAVDGANNIIVVGTTLATTTGFPTTTGAFQTTSGGSWDGWAAKFASTGTRNWATYYGGNNIDYAYAVDCDASDNVFFTGWTRSGNFPVTTGAYQTTCGGCATYYDSYVVKMDSSGVQQWATFFGGSLDENYDGNGDGGVGLAIDASNNVVIAGYTKSANLPTTTGAHQTARAGTAVNRDGYIAKFSNAGARQWATYYGGSSDDDAHGVATDDDNNVVITGGTLSTNFPTTARPYQGSNNGMNDAYVASFDSNGTRRWATYYGGSSVDYATEVVTEGSDYLYITGNTTSSNFPVSSGAQQTTCGGCTGSYDAFVVKLCMNEFIPSVAVSGPLTFCQGDSVTLTAQLGFDTYLWSTGAITQSITVGTTGNYWVIATDAGGCSGISDTLKVKVNTKPIANAGADRTVCFGSSIGIGGTPTASGGAGRYNIRWTPIAGLNNDTIANPVATPLLTTTYVVTVVDTNGCMARDTMIVRVNELPQANAGADDTICSGQSTTIGTTLGATGGKAPYTVDWRVISGSTVKPPSVPMPLVRPAITTLYELVITDANGCIGRDTMRVLVHPTPIVDLTDSLRLCRGDTIQLGANPIVTGGTPPYTFLWTPSTGLSSVSIANPVAFPSTTTRYRLLVTDAFGCSTQDSVLLQVGLPPVVDAGISDTLCFGTSLLIGGKPTAAGGTAPYRYRWVPADGLSSDTIATPIAEPTRTTTYHLFVTDANGCTAADSMTLTVLPRLRADAGGDIEFCDGGSALLGGSTVAEGGLPAYRYQWTPATGLSSVTEPNPKATPSLTTRYILVVTDAFGCVARDTVLVTVNTPPIANAGRDTTICFGTSVRLGGTPTATGGNGILVYSWTPTTGLTSPYSANPVVTPQGNATYIVNVSDGKGCEHSDTVRVNVLPQLTVDAGPDQQSCASREVILGNFATVNGGLPPYRYRWFPTAGILNPDSLITSAVPPATTIYTLTITDANNCSATDSFRVIINPLPRPVITPAGPLSLCEGDSIRLSVSGDFRQYLWSDGRVGKSIVVRRGNTYAVTVTDSNGCSAQSLPVTVNIHPPPIPTVNGPKAVCVGTPVEYSTAQGAGFSYVWQVDTGGKIISGGATSKAMVVWSNAGTGKVWVDVVNRNTNCAGVALPLNVRVDNALQPVITLAGDSLLCGGDSMTLDAGAGYDTYRWSTGETARRITVKKPGSYSVTVTLGGNCSGTSSPVEITVKPGTRPEPKISTSGATNICEGDSITLDAGAGASYVWSTGATTRWIQVNNAGSYWVVVGNSEGCLGRSDTVVVGVQPRPQPEIIAGGSLEFCNGGSVTLSATAGYTSYRWSTGDTTQSITVPTPGSYMVTAIGANGCSGNSKPVQVIVRNPPTPVPVGSSSVCWDRVAGYRLTTPTVDTCTWSVIGGVILGGQGSDSITVQWGREASGSIIVRQRDGVTACLGESQPLRVTIDEVLRPAITATGSLTLCEGDTVVLNAGDGYSSYRWSNGDTTQTTQISTGGIYTVSVADDGGCGGTSNPLRVTVNPRPIVAITPLGRTNVCEGDSLSLEAPTAMAAYRWSTGDTTPRIVVRRSGTYRLQGMNAIGCWGESLPITVMVHALPTPSIMISSNTNGGGIIELFDGDTLQLSADRLYATYRWSTGDTVRSIIVREPGSYTLTVTDTNGCSGATSPLSIKGLSDASAIVELPRIEAKPGDRVSIPIRLPRAVNLSKSRKISAGGDDSIRVEGVLRFNRSLLLPVGDTPMGTISEGERVIPIRATLPAGIVDTTTLLGIYQFTAALGNAAATPLMLDSVRWPGRQVRTTVIAGEFHLAAICPEGGERLFNADGKVGLKPAVPNPARGQTIINYEAVEPGRTRLTLVDQAGRTILRIVDAEIIPGSYVVHFDASIIPSGSYFLLLETPTQRISQELRVEK